MPERIVLLHVCLFFSTSAELSCYLIQLWWIHTLYTVDGKVRWCSSRGLATHPDMPRLRKLKLLTHHINGCSSSTLPYHTIWYLPSVHTYKSVLVQFWSIHGMYIGFSTSDIPLPYKLPLLMLVDYCYCLTNELHVSMTYLFFIFCIAP